MYDYKAKDKNLSQYNNYTLAKTLSMFEYSGLPETIPYYELEKLLQKKGYAFITEVEGELYAFTGGLGGEQDVYGNPTKITISNPALNFNKTLDIKSDGVLIRNDDLLVGLLPLLNKYNSALVENDINMLMVGYNSRMQTLLSASDDKTKTSAEEFLTKMVDGEVGVIGEAALFDGVKTHNSGTTQGNAITALIEFHQYMKGGLNNELGLKSNFNMKRERLTSGEVDSVEDELYPFIDNMMKCRLKAIEEINEKYATAINVDYGSIWNKKNRELVDDILPTEEGEELSTNDSETLPSELSQESSMKSLEESSSVGSEEETLEESSEESLEETLEESSDESLEESSDEERRELEDMLEDRKGGYNA